MKVYLDNDITSVEIEQNMLFPTDTFLSILVKSLVAMGYSKEDLVKALSEHEDG